jgi:putative ubiquitin-RnfH superfamily antitoxin RatB of RatAB toxin-antitoxin module
MAASKPRTDGAPSTQVDTSLTQADALSTPIDASFARAAASSSPAGASLTVSVYFADVAAVWSRQLEIAVGTTVQEAIAASGFIAMHPGTDPWLMGVGVFGRSVRRDTVLAQGDRIEIYRPLSFDPTVSRRRRALHRSRQRHE